MYMKKYSIGIDLGGTKILIALVDRNTGEVLEHVKKKTKKDINRYILKQKEGYRLKPRTVKKGFLGVMG